ncbi:hypothetical protein MtrunA17_Chr2g0329281 [Medicago truncatula]|uniref:Uncharacterized protein n=1 Tax=Medicago truncatula TaxID=3880 RepID=A0A396JIK0_MEDTR|nr:hypothetical protein MtrunA17_Chr2g0329281 [Medicago truncatula]
MLVVVVRCLSWQHHRSPLFSSDDPPSDVSLLFRRRSSICSGCLLFLWFFGYGSDLKATEIRLLPSRRIEVRGCFVFVLPFRRISFSKVVRHCFRRRSGQCLLRFPAMVALEVEAGCGFVPDSVTLFENLLSGFTGFRMWILLFFSSVCDESCVRLRLLERARCVDAPC